jgi:hypothetical protein
MLLAVLLLLVVMWVGAVVCEVRSVTVSTIFLSSSSVVRIVLVLVVASTSSYHQRALLPRRVVSLSRCYSLLLLLHTRS